MKYTILIALFAMPLSAPGAFAQVGDWQAVQALPGGTKIKVQLIHRHTFGHCVFEGATDDQLACTFGGGIFSRREVFPRQDVRAVFRTHNGTLIGIGVGAGAGAVLGASHSTCCRGAYAFFGAVAFGAVGAVVGTAADPFFHGKTVYRSASPPAKQPSPKHAQKGDESPTVANEENASEATTKIPCLRDGVTLQCVP